MAGIPGQTSMNSCQSAHDMIFPKAAIFEMVLVASECLACGMHALNCSDEL